jgi:C1A family cysteine protease
MPVDFKLMSATLKSRNARWQSKSNSMTEMERPTRRRLLGFVPGPNELSLKNREDLSKVHHQAYKLAMTALAAAPPLHPATYDLRNVSGQNFITVVKDQGQCGSCVAFGSVAAIEGTFQVASSNPNTGVDLSEAQLFYCYGGAAGRVCGYNHETNSGWWPAAALEASKSGLCKAACFPYTDQDQDCGGLCAQWQTDAYKISGWHAANAISDMKGWISNRGPMVTAMTVYEDFYSYSTGVYHYVTGAQEGGHCVCAVGYDDTNDCWICKNSWNASWGESGFFRIGYGECGIDATMYAVEGVVPV